VGQTYQKTVPSCIQSHAWADLYACARAHHPYPSTDGVQNFVWGYRASVLVLLLEASSDG